MFPPVPAAFNGSVPEEGVPPHRDGGARLPARLDRALAAMCVVSGGAAVAGLSLGGAELPPADGAKLICAAILFPALLGMWLLEQLQEAPNLAVTRIYSLVQHRLRAEAGAQAVARHPREDSYGGLAGLIADSVANLRRLQAGRVRSDAAALATNQALQAGREQAGALADMLRRDAASMADAASGIMVASARLEEDAATARIGTETARLSVSQVIGHATGLAAAVGAITGHINRMTQAAASAAQSAFGAHASVAGLAERTTTLSSAAEAACLLLVEAGARPARAADLALDVAAAVATMQRTVGDLQTELALAVRHVTELSGVIQTQQDAGAAVSQAVDRQGAEIRQVLILLQEAHAGFDQVRDGVAGLSRHGADRQAEAEAIRGAANRLPAHADVISGILRSIPDFTPPLEF